MIAGSSSLLPRAGTAFFRPPRPVLSWWAPLALRAGSSIPRLPARTSVGILGCSRPIRRTGRPAL